MTIKTVRNSGELLALNGERFIRSAYRALLGRDADEAGLAHHLADLEAGLPKLKIVDGFVRSDEGKAFAAKLPGLAEALIEAKVADIGEALAAAGNGEDVRVLLDYLCLVPRVSQDDLIASWQENLVGAWQGAGPDLVFIEPAAERSADASLWCDVTELFRPDAAVMQMRMRLAFVAVLRRFRSTLRLLLQIEDVLVEIVAEQLDRFFDDQFMADAFAAAYFPTDGSDAGQLAVVSLPDGASHPCSAGDTVVTWASIAKKTDRILSRSFADSAGTVKLCHVFSEDSLAEMASPRNRTSAGDRLTRYLWWLSTNSGLLIFTSELARSTMVTLQAQANAPIVPHVTLDAFDRGAPLDVQIAAELVADLGIGGRYALYAGAFDTASNMETVYRAWLLADELQSGAVPKLVLALSSDVRAQDLLEAMQVDPRLKDQVVIIRPSEREMSALLVEAAFVLCPATCGRASAMLDDVVRFNKAAIVADGAHIEASNTGNLVFVHAIDVRGWANAILEMNLKPDGEPGTRIDAAESSVSDQKDLAKALDVVDVDTAVASGEVAGAPPAVKPTIWMDLTLTFLDWGGHITGIVRAELTFAYYLKKLAPETRYFAYTRGNPGYFFEIEPANLDWLFNAIDLSESYRNFNLFWKDVEAKGEGHRDPFRMVGHAVPGHPAYLGTFPANAVVFFAAIDQDGTGKLSRCVDVLKMVDDGQATMTSQLIYDLTPFLMPQVHHEFTVRGYLPFVEFVSDHFDHLVYGGRTAQRDAIRIQREAGWRSPPSTFVEFGSDISLSGDSVLPPTERPRSIIGERKILDRLGITGAFLITVGSLEPRKNHELLYKAYLELLERETLDRPFQMVFIGKRGWKIDDLLATIAADERIRDKLLILSPTDEELEALYHQCRFTLLPSFYEGWSLTLPESLSYGKFCLVSDVDPLREAGGDLVEYIHPLDTMAWADRIEHYLNRPEEVAEWERKIRQGWHPRTWHEASASLIERLRAAHAERYPY